MKSFKKNIVLSIKKLGWRIMDTGKIEIKTENGSFNQIRFMGSGYWKHMIHANRGGIEQPIFYLKINRDAPYTIECIQMWLDVIKDVGADYYFVCDNKWLEHKVLKSCFFPNDDIKFISSFGKNMIRNAENLYTGNWKNATYAHLTPFYHAKKNGFNNFWSIDADDTFFLMNSERIATALKCVQNYAFESCMDITSLDMWLSRTCGQHWSFGITYVDTTRVDYIGIFDTVSSQAWMKSYSDIEEIFNLDWFFTFLRDKTEVNVGSFYVNHCWFVHFGNFISNPIYGWINYWDSGKIHYPILESVYNNMEIGCLNIANNVFSIDVGASKEEGMKILENRVCKSRYFKQQQHRLFDNENFANDKNFFRI